jgi:hypothetical protein
MEAMKKCKDEISEASAATEVPWEVVWPLLLGGRCGSSAMVKELFFVDLCVSFLA